MSELHAVPRRDLVEVWGDTVALPHLAGAIAIGAVVSLVFYFAASRTLVAVVSTPALARAYAMLAGLAGCVIAGVICARLFPPKRTVTEGTDADPAARRAVLDRLAEEVGDLGAVHDLPDVVAQEMKELRIYDLFAERETPAAAPAPTPPAAPRVLRVAAISEKV